MQNNGVIIPTRYDGFSRLLHWLVAIVIIYAMCMGYILHILEGTPYFQFFSVLNMTLGTLATPIMLVRFIWRFFRPSVPYPAEIGHMKKSFLIFVHEVFYLTIFVTLVSGFLMLEKGYNLFGLWPIPQPIQNLEVNRFFFIVHRYACITLGVILVGHVAAVIHYYLAGKKAIIARML